jgi:hypothetical protein
MGASRLQAAMTASAVRIAAPVSAFTVEWDAQLINSPEICMNDRRVNILLPRCLVRWQQRLSEVKLLSHIVGNAFQAVQPANDDKLHVVLK